MLSIECSRVSPISAQGKNFPFWTKGCHHSLPLYTDPLAVKRKRWWKWPPCVITRRGGASAAAATIASRRACSPCLCSTVPGNKATAILFCTSSAMPCLWGSRVLLSGMHLLVHLKDHQQGTCHMLTELVWFLLKCCSVFACLPSLISF